eukprot:TRINITY_DN1725_c0_g1_i11.p1 TRINITY_DN1725_c0_g1~~TRINITY_DN1725_c0_g1_i11.p1  ORF type:complete len:126 (-),score=22.23 TRINITY_DN1725_c0_g1_i11:232-609(-)
MAMYSAAGGVLFLLLCLNSAAGDCDTRHQICADQLDDLDSELVEARATSSSLLQAKSVGKRPGSMATVKKHGGSQVRVRQATRTIELGTDADGTGPKQAGVHRRTVVEFSGREDELLKAFRTPPS